MNYAELKTGEITALVGDNTSHGQHKNGYNGLWSLTSVHEPRNLFVPLYAGLNLEHIFDGRAMKAVEERFEPRYSPMQLTGVTDVSATLHQPPTFHSQFESWTTFKVKPPYYIDFEFRCVPRGAVFTGDYIGLFWASYINAPVDKSIYFPHEAKADGSVIWQQFCTQWHNRDSTVLHRSDAFQPQFAPEERALYVYTSQIRYALPLYYGRFGDMTLIYMFDRVEGIRLTHSPSGGGWAPAGDDTNPAWDFQFIIHPWEVGREYGFRLRAAYKRWSGRADILEEYGKFHASLLTK